MSDQPHETRTVRSLVIDGLRAADPTWNALWCPSCLRASLMGPAPKREYNLLWPGERNCRQEMLGGTPLDAIKSIEELTNAR